MASTANEKFCLRWNDFETNISTSFKELRDDQDFFDVTLACGDDKQVQAHKVILSACSPFFRCILKKNPHPHPLLYLKGVKYEEVLSVLDFMYHGEVNVAQEDLSSFLAVAKELEVKGLTQEDSEEKSNTQSTIEKSRNKLFDKQIVSPQKGIQNYERGMSLNADTVQQIKTEEPVVIDCDPDQDIPVQPIVDCNDYQAHSSEYGYNQDYVDDQFESGEGQNLDLAQGIAFYNYLQYHYMSYDFLSKVNFSDFGIHQNLSWKTGRSEKKNVPCDICFKTFSSKDSLRNHLGIHKGRTTCSICQKVFATISSLNLHIKNSHVRDQ